MKRLPRVKNLGDGHRYTVTLVSKSALQEIAKPLDEDNADGELDGIVDPDTRTIYILKTLSLALRWAAYFHELNHITNDLAAKYQHGLEL